jgi:hypothetical protein
LKNQNTYQSVSESASTDSVVPWIGEYVQENGGLSVKRLLLTLPGAIMGSWSGRLVVSDEQAGRCVIPYAIHKRYVEDFVNHPSHSTYWRCYSGGDITHYLLKYPGPMLQFYFPSGDTSPTRSAGIVSTFSVRGDFRIGVDFMLRDDMLDGFTVGFLISDTQDTSRWLNRAGVFLTGNVENTSRWVAVTAGVGINTVRQDAKEGKWSDGRLFIERSNGKVVFEYHEMNLEPTSMIIDNIFTFAADAVYIHLRMKIDDTERTRNCQWDNLVVYSGEMVFNN